MEGALQLNAIRPGFVAEAEGLDPARPLSAGAVEAVRAAFADYGVLVFRGCRQMEDAQLEAFGRQFGPLFNTASGFKQHGARSIVRITNLDSEGRLLPEDHSFRASNAANAFWHVDNSFSEPPAKFSALLARVVPPEGGETEFADARGAYDALPPETKRRIEGLEAVHSYIHSRSLTGVTFTEEQRQALPDRVRPLALRDARTGRRALYLSSHIRELLGVEPVETRRLLDELTRFATQPQFVYRHPWRPGDLLMYDNQAVLHRAMPFSDMVYPRDMRALRVMLEPETGA